MASEEEKASVQVPVAKQVESSTPSVVESQPVGDEFPEGGLKAWTTVAGCWVTLFSTFGYLYSFGVYNDFYVREYLTNHTPSSIAWIGSFQLMMPFLLGVVSGKLFDEGYFHVVQILGACLWILSIFMLSLTKPFNYYQVFLAQGLCAGVGLGLVFVPTTSIIVHHFKRRKGFATGVALSGASCGAVTFPIMLNKLLPRLGFAQAVRATGYLVLGMLVIGNCLMRTRLPPRRFRPNAPAPDIKSFFVDPPYLWAILGALISSLGVWFPVLYLQLYSVQHHVDLNLAFYSIAIVNGAGGFGRIFGNSLVDKYGTFNVQVPVTVITAATVWAVLGVKHTSSLIAVSVLYGFFSGAWLSLAIAGLGSLAKGPEEVGARIGLALALSSFGSLGSAPIQGALLTDEFKWIKPIAFSGTCVFGGAICFGMTRYLLGKRHGHQKV